MVDPVSPSRSSHFPPPYPPPSTLPLPKPPFSTSSSPSSSPRMSTTPVISTNASASGSGSGSHSGSSSSALPSYDSLPTSSHFTRRRSSQTDVTTTASTPSTVSTAPTTPAISQRSWRPTPHVPPQIANRHRHRAGASGGGVDDEERNRWLSEDEGLESVGIGRRRRRRSSGEDDLPPADQSSRSGTTTSKTPDGSRTVGARLDGQDNAPGPGPSTLQRRFEEKQALLASVSSRSDRPKARRARSFEPSRSVEPPRNFGAEDVTVGTQPPRIQDIVPEPGSPVQLMGLGISQQSADLTSSGIETMSSAVPDFAAGRGGDGIGGVGMPLGDHENADPAMSRRQERRSLLGKLYRILGCANCPTDQGVPRPLHHPITLPCGHTLSSSHISIPAPAPLHIDPSLPAHEIFALQQRQHQLRLNLWAGVMCPIPSCKRYSPHVSTSPIVPVTQESVEGSPQRMASGAQRAEMLASGVTYYPPPLPAPPAYSAEAPVTETGSPLLDISVDKILCLVVSEMRKEELVDRSALRHVPEVDETDDSDAEEDGGGALTDNEQFAPSSPLVRQSSKRRRNTVRDRPRDSSAGSQEWSFKKDLMSIVECDVCAMMLSDPVTTPCQHSFCSKCLSRSLDHSSRCPLCRQDLPSFAFFQDHSVNRVLLAIIKTAFPEEYAERCASIEREERDGRLDTPIFVCTLAFPGMPTILHVFEPRYRLMIRRCIESSSPRFGMVLPARGTQQPGGGGLQGVMEYGTMLEIQSVQMLPDGRSMVETVGSHRFKLLEKGNLDGYTVGRIERIDDISQEEDDQLIEAAMRATALRGEQSQSTSTPHSAAAATPPPGAPMLGGIPTIVPGTMPADDDVHTTEDYMNICRSFIDQLRSGSAPWLLQRLNNTYGTMPTDPSEFSYWMALVMPIDEYEKARLLPIRSPRLRLKLIVHWVESLRSSWWFSSGCVVG